MTDETLISEAQDNTDASEDNPSNQSPEGQSAEDQADSKAQKLEGEADATSEDKSDDDGKGDAAPDEYAAFNLPEDVAIDEKALEAASPVFKDMNLSQEQAQGLVDLFANITQQQSEALAEQAASIREEWRDGIKTHKDFGGDKLEESLGLTARAIDAAFGNPPAKPNENDQKAVDAYLAHPSVQFRQALAETGLGDHPLFFEFMVKVGKSVSEGSFVNASSANAAPKTHADVLYPTQS